MSRIKRGVTTHAKHKRILEQAKGLSWPAQEHHPHRPPGGREGRAVRLPRPQGEEAHVSRAVDPADQRSGAERGADLLTVHPRHQAAGIELDRKTMADLAMNEGGVFSAVIAQAKAALPA